MNKYVVILAAGRGTRMKSLDAVHSKISYPIMGKPILEYVLDAVEPLEFNKTIVVAGFGGETTKQIVGDRAKVIQEDELSETASTVNMARKDLKDKKGQTLIVYGDIPLITTHTLKRVFKKHEKNGNGLTILTSVLTNPDGYARIVREHKSNLVLSVREEEELDEYQKTDLNEVNAGVYLFDNELLFKYLNANVHSVSNLVEKFVKSGIKTEAYVLEDPEEMYSINNRVQLAYAAKVIRKRVNHDLMMSGVSIEDPDTTYISPDVTIEQDSIIMPNTTIVGKTKIGKNNWLGPNTYINNVTMGDGNVISFSWLSDVTLGNVNHVGPFAKIYAESELGNNNDVGNFVELKKTKLGNEIFAKHLSYLGDASIGDRTNIGCMSVTANYDGVNKHQTLIGNNVFIGTGSILIAPVTVEDNAFVAAGTVVTKDVKDGELAIAREEQKNVPGGAKKVLGKRK